MGKRSQIHEIKVQLSTRPKVCKGCGEVIVDDQPRMHITEAVDVNGATVGFEVGLLCTMCFGVGFIETKAKSLGEANER